MKNKINKKGFGLPGVIFSIILLSVVFGAIVLIMADFDKQYVQKGISNVSYNKSIIEKYGNVSQELNDSFSEVNDGFLKITESSGFLDLIGNGILAFALAILAVPGALFSVGALGIGLVTGIGIDLGINVILITMGTIALSIFVLIRMIEWWQRSKL